MNIHLNENKVVLITGGNSGIGEACAKLFSQRGYAVIITARRHVEGNRVADQINKSGGRCEFIPADLADPFEIQRLFNTVLNKYTAIDCAINNAGMEGQSFTQLTDYPEDVWDSVLNLNLKSVWLCMKREITQMLSQKSKGCIVNVASTAGLKASVTGGCAYTASKHGLVGLTKTAALEYAKENVRVNAVCPAFVNTPMAQEVLGNKLESMGELHPLKRLCTPEEVAEAIYWLSSEQSSFITGIAMPIDGGVTA